MSDKTIEDLKRHLFSEVVNAIQGAFSPRLEALNSYAGASKCYSHLDEQYRPYKELGPKAIDERLNLIALQDELCQLARKIISEKS